MNSGGMYGRASNVPAVCRVMQGIPGECMGVGAKCEGNSGECQGDVREWVKYAWGMEGNARE